MPSLKQLIQDRVDRLESVPNTLLSKIDQQNEILFKEILKELDSIETKDGKIITTAENLAKVGAITERLQEVLFGGEYVKAIQSFASEINTQAKLNNQILDKVIGSFEDNAIYGATVKAAQRNALLLLDQSAINTELLQPISDILTNAIVNAASFTESVEILRQNMTGEAALLSKYAGTYTKDAFAAADRQYVQLTAREHEIIFYRYDGGDIADTRLFCLERINGVYHELEIAAWGNNRNTRPGEFKRPAKSPVYTNPNGVKLYWEGENYDTNQATIFSFCGGYNCRHVLVPLATEYVPKIDLQRAIDLGYYKP